MPSVTIYSSPCCPYSVLAKEFFERNEIPYREIDVSRHREAVYEIIKKTGQICVPVIIVKSGGGEEITVGFDPQKLIKLLGIGNGRDKKGKGGGI